MSKSDTPLQIVTQQPPREPNDISTDPNAPNPLMQPFDFNRFRFSEENKAQRNTKMTLDQFSRKVHSKQNLLYALGVKGE